MERLWTPWRMEYVGGSKRDTCVFCAALAACDDAETLILRRATRAFIILNLYPYNTGHAMVVPNAHAADLDQLDAATRGELMELATLFTTVARRVLRCAGFNLGLNLGEAAGAGVAAHLHLHAVPRWLGDANFMPILAGTAVMPELLPVTYARLRAEIERVLCEQRPGWVARAGALVVLPARRALLLRRTPDGEVAFPNGDIAADETASDCAMRVARAQTGVAAAVAGWGGSFTCEPAPGSRAPHAVSVLLARGDETPDVAEHVRRDALLVPIEQAPEALTAQPARDIATAALPALRRLVEGASA